MTDLCPECGHPTHRHQESTGCCALDGDELCDCLLAPPFIGSQAPVKEAEADA